MTREEAEKEIRETFTDVWADGISKALEQWLSKMYQQGLNDAWECARKIILSCSEGGYDAGTIADIFGMSYHDVLKECKPNKVIELIKEYEERQASAKDCKKCKHFIDADEVHGYTPCGSCGADLQNFEPKQTDATDINDGSIKVGDEVRMKGSDPVRDDCDYGICTWSLPNVNTIYVMHRDGSSGQANKDEWYRTGRYFPQIAEVLKLL